MAVHSLLSRTRLLRRCAPRDDWIVIASEAKQSRSASTAYEKTVVANDEVWGEAPKVVI